MSDIHAWIHLYAPHSGEALYIWSLATGLVAVGLVYFRCLHTGSQNHLPLAWTVSTAATAAPAPTWILLLLAPLDRDLLQTIANDPVTLALAGLYGLAAAFRDLRNLSADSLKRMKAGQPPTAA